MIRVISVIAVAASGVQAHAATITIPWLVEFPRTVTNPPPARTVDVSAPEIDGRFRTVRGGIDAPGIDVRAGLNIDAAATTSRSAFRFPVEVTIEAPERIRPGQTINLETSFRPIDTPSNPAFYRVEGDARFSTDVEIDIQSDTFNIDETIDFSLPDRVEQGPITARFGGDGRFEAEDDSGRQVASRVSFDEDVFGQSLRPRGTLTQGYEFVAADTIDGVEAAIDLVDVVAAFVPVLEPVAQVVDLDIGGGFDILASNTLTTNLGVAYYTYDGLDNDGFNFDQIDLTRNGAGASLRAPDDLQDGETFDVFFSALGLGFNVLSELGLQGNFDLDLNLDLALVEPSLELLSFDVGDPIIFDQDITTFFFTEFLTEFMDPTDAVLSMLVDSGADELPGGIRPIDGAPSADDGLNLALGTGALGPGEPVDLGVAFDAPGAPPRALPVITTTVVPLPPALSLLLAGIGALVAASRRREAGSAALR